MCHGHDAILGTFPKSANQRTFCLDLCLGESEDTEQQNSVLQSHERGPLLDERKSSPFFTLPVRYSVLTGSRSVGNVTDWGNRSRGGPDHKTSKSGSES